MKQMYRSKILKKYKYVEKNLGNAILNMFKMENTHILKQNTKSQDTKIELVQF